MKTISKREFNKAYKIVQAYNKQQEQKVVLKECPEGYNFLYWLTESISDQNTRSRNVKAKDINSAITKFLKSAPKSLVKVDYEVMIGRQAFDISGHPEINKYI